MFLIFHLVSSFFSFDYICALIIIPYFVSPLCSLIFFSLSLNFSLRISSYSHHSENNSLTPNLILESPAHHQSSHLPNTKWAITVFTFLVFLSLAGKRGRDLGRGILKNGIFHIFIIRILMPSNHSHTYTELLNHH